MFYLKLLSLLIFLISFSISFADNIFIKSGNAVIKVASDDDDDENFFDDKEFFKDDDDDDDDSNLKSGKVNVIEGESCGLNIKDKDVENSVIKNKVIINGKRVNKSCFKNGGSSVNMGISIEGGAKIKNSVIKNESIIKDSEITINGKKVVK